MLQVSVTWSNSILLYYSTEVNEVSPEGMEYRKDRNKTSLWLINILGIFSISFLQLSEMSDIPLENLEFAKVSELL